MSTSDRTHPRSTPSDRLRRQYHLALGLIACLTLCSQLVVQSALRRLEADAPVIKLAGDQVKLSKQMCKDAMELAAATAPDRILEEVQDIRSRLTHWSIVHRGLLQGDEGLQIPTVQSPHIRQLLAGVEPQYQTIFASVTDLLALAGDGELTRAERMRVDWFAARMNAAEERYARAMEAVVSGFESEVTGRLNWMKQVELALMGVTLMALLIEALMVFRPATKMIRRQITALQRQTQHLQKARLQAEAASRAKTCFLTNMSHEIRTPMTAILGFAEQLRDPGLAAADQARFVDRITAQGHHLASLINNILDLAASESGTLVTQPVRCGPRQVVADVIANLAPRAAAKGLTLALSCRGKLPTSVQTDPGRLRQVVSHLVDNAIKFTRNGGVTVAISLPDPAAEKLRIDVIDTGSGLSAEQQQRLFQPFMQADESLTRRSGGLGIELALGKRIAQALGGDLTVNSEVGRGSTFTIELSTGSLAGVDLVAEITPPQIAVLTVPPDAAAGKRILVVDDAPDIQRLLQFVLTKSGAMVTLAHHGEAGVAAVLEAQQRRQPFDLVFMDMQMPVLDGYSATARLRQLGHTLPIVAVTAHAMAGEREKCLAAGCTDYLAKPVDRGRLLEMIHRYARPSAAVAA